MSAGEQAAMIKTMVARLAGKLRANPEDPAGWMRLGRAYVVLGKRVKAIDAYSQAARRWPASSSEQAQAKAEIARLKALPDR
jgi:cytochrome c-type biogenesis protein CcmH